MSIAEYQMSLKNIIDATTDETILKRWHSQLEADLSQKEVSISEDKEESLLSEPTQETEAEKKKDTSDYVLVESGLGINE